MIIVTEYR